MLDAAISTLGASDLIVGLAAFALTELAKRYEDFPLDPNNKNEVKTFALTIAFLIVLFKSVVSGSLALLDWKSALLSIASEWVLAVVTAHAAYQATPFMKGVTGDPEKPQEADTEDGNA